MKIAMHQITSRNATMEEDLAAYGGSGWSAFELHLGKAEAYLEGRDLEALGDLVRASGLTAVACTGHVVEAFADEDAVEKSRRSLDRALEVMAAVDCPVIVFGGDGPAELKPGTDFSEAGLTARDNELESARRRFADQVSALAEVAADRGVTMALEMNWCRLCRSVWSAARVLDLVDRDNVGFLFDAAHFAVSPSRLGDLEMVTGRIVHGHLDDMRAATPEDWSVNGDRVIPGDGCLPLRSWYEQVTACGYSGWHAVELFCEDLWDLPAEEISQRTMVGCRKVWPEARF